MLFFNFSVNDRRIYFVAQQINGEKCVDGVTLAGKMVGTNTIKKFGQ